MHTLTTPATPAIPTIPTSVICPLVDGITVEHYFADGIYTKQVTMAAGCSITGHKHLHNHLSLLAYGSVIVEIHGMQQLYNGPMALNILSECVHKITAVTPALWYCVHSVSQDELDRVGMDGIDATLIKL